MPFWRVFAKPGVIATRVQLHLSAEAARRRRADRLLRPPPQPARRHAEQAGRSLDDRATKAEQVLRLRRAVDGLLEPGDRGERALRRLARDAVVHDDRAVPRERPPLPPDAAPRGRAAVAARQQRAVHRRRCGRLVAAGRGVAGIVREVYFPAPLIYKQGPILRQPDAPAGVPQRHPRLLEDRDSGLEARDLPRLPDDEGNRRPRRPRGEALVPDREMAGARGPVRREGDALQLDLVVGLGAVDDDARGTGPREADRGVRVPLDAQPAPLQRARHGRQGLRALPGRGSAHAPVRASAACSRARSFRGT